MAWGHAGGVWTLSSQGSRFKFSIVKSMQQCIRVRISLGNHSWVGTGVYATPDYSFKCQLWEYLVNLMNRILEPWALIEDFQ